MKKLLIAVALACLSCSTAAAADAPDKMYLPSLDVYYGDLNLANRNGAQVALRRIKNAASDVCGGAPDSMLDLNGRRIYKSCTRVAVDEAVKQLKAPLLAALHAGDDVRQPRMASVP